MNRQSYFDTTRLEFEKLLEAIDAAERQDDKVLLFFSSNYHRAFSPSDVWAILASKLNRAPLTSVRRSISNLTRRGALVKLERKKDGRLWSAGASLAIQFRIQKKGAKCLIAEVAELRSSGSA
jgi:hypothetical protein